MDKVEALLKVIVTSIVDNESAVVVTELVGPKGPYFEISVAKDDVGKIIGKEGRIANAIRTIAKAAGAKLDRRIMVNILNIPAA